MNRVTSVTEFLQWGCVMRARVTVFLSCVLAIPLAGTVLAQAPPPTILRWQYGAADSDLIVRNGLQIAILDHEGLSVRVALTGQDRRHVALVGVINQTPDRVEVVPSEITFVLLEPERKTFPYHDPDELAKNPRIKAALAEVLAAMLSYQRFQTAGEIYRTLRGATSDSTTTTYPDLSDTALAAGGPAKEGEPSTIERGALRENTLLPGGRVSGAVFFDVPRDYDRDYGTGKLETVLAVPIDHYLFQFPFWWDGKLATKCEKPLLGGRRQCTFAFPLSWSVPQPSPPATTIVSEQTGQPQAPGGPPTANVEPATVVVNSTPDGADITVDGNYVGSTPSTLRLEPGEHGVSVEKSGFKPWQRKVTLTAGSSPTISATLEKGLVTSPEANTAKPKDELRNIEGSPSATSDLSGSYAGAVANTTTGGSAPFAIDIREENGGIYGCTTVQKPLFGSGGFQGTVNGSKVVFEAAGKKVRIRFIGELQGDALKGSFTVLSTQQHGNFELRRVDSKAPPIGFNPAQCRKD
jgi:hypothetical protein